ncbi:hypothetical protein ACIGMX_02240 [Streptomyces aquilus]|uniref:hypothetical protein n=1 Tax=Streptomyces aquilus TaxID=2548456 RepID=UPI0037CDA5B7
MTLPTCPVPPDMLTAACAEARSRYAARVPAPRPEGSPCRYCGAAVGVLCTRPDGSPTGPHRPRENRWATAHDAWQLAVEQACDDAVNALCALAAA